MAGFCRLMQELGLTRTELSSLLSHVSHRAIEVFWHLVLKEQSDLNPQ